MLRRLNDGRSIPRIGLGTWPLRGDEAARVVADALDVGYRHIDTAAKYENEDAVGRGIRDSGVDRSDVWITTKLDGQAQGEGKARAALHASLERLGTDRVDLLLIHWPLPRRDQYVSTWETFIELRDEGLAASIGVSNFLPAHVDRLIAETGIVPAVNQLQISPPIPRVGERAHADQNGIAVESWSPLGGDGAEVLQQEVVAEVAERIGCTPAQAVIAWHLAHDLIPLPKSADCRRLEQNLAAADVVLGDADLAALATLDLGPGAGVDPETTGH
jgi:2,5-diketo-D-gluconate reductase A